MMIIDAFNTWSPLWTFYYDQNGNEHSTIQKIANGTIAFPFNPKLGYMELYSLPSGKFITRVNLTPTVERFCIENPIDPNCKPPVIKMTCKDNPADPNCKPTTHKAFCESHPADPRCRSTLNNLLANSSNSASFVNKSFVGR
jgi:hypothetical protein